MKEIQVGKLPVKVCEHKGDINYLRFVKFKQYAPQFWERMDSPLFAEYFDRFKAEYNKGNHAQGFAILLDYQFAIQNVKEKSYDAWGVCFALITVLEGEDAKSDLNELEIEKKIKRFTDEGKSAEQVKAEVVNFMMASPEIFVKHLTIIDIPGMLSEAANSEG
jgi:hypothetical protein